MVNNKLLLCGDIETNPGPDHNKMFKFVCWNLNSICTREKVKISLPEAYNSTHHLDIIALSETMLNSPTSNDEIKIAGFNNDILRSDHPSEAKIRRCMQLFSSWSTN